MKIPLQHSAAALATLVLLSLAWGQDPAQPDEQQSEPRKNLSTAESGGRYALPQAGGGGGRGGRGSPAPRVPRAPRPPSTATLQAERHENWKDAVQLVQLSEQLKREIERNSSFVLSVSAVKKTDEIEKVVKRLRDRMVRN